MCDPRLIVSMGGVIGSLVPGLKLDTHWGFPFLWDVPGAGERELFPTFHPALGLHSPKEVLRLRNCFVRLRKHLQGKLRLPVDRYPEPDYTVVNTVEELDLYFQQHTDWGTRLDLSMALDTEITRSREPFCLTFSIHPGTARLVLASSREVLDRLMWWISQWQGNFLLHNRPFDRPILMQMGVSLPPKRIIDTMQEAWHLGNLQQGLKTLAWRELGVEMQDFDDLVTPHSRALALSYLASGLTAKWERPEPSMTRDAEGMWKEYRPQSFGTKLKRFFTDLEKNPELDVFERWDNWEDDHRIVEEKLGRFPGKCITHTPLEEVVSYACRDAAVTLEIWPLLKRASKLVRRRPQDAWYDS